MDLNKNKFGLVSLALSILFAPALLTNCETEITADLPAPTEKIVVEGSIESGGTPLVILNKNFPYFGTFNFETYSETFVKNAEVRVSDGETEVLLDEVCLSELTEDQLEVAQELLGVTIADSLLNSFDFCVYTILDLIPPIIGEYGKTYSLDILTEDQVHLTSSTKIPNPVPIDSLWLVQHQDEDYSDLWRVFGQLKDPDTIGNYYRYFTKYNSQPFLPGLASVFDDAFVNGADFFFPLDRAIQRGEDVDFNLYGYSNVGDTVVVKWTTIDKGSYDFWNTLEFGANSAGPLSGGTKFKTNINGGIGIWCGYGISTEETMLIEPQ